MRVSARARLRITPARARHARACVFINQRSGAAARVVTSGMRARHAAEPRRITPAPHALPHSSAMARRKARRGGGFYKTILFLFMMRRCTIL